MLYKRSEYFRYTFGEPLDAQFRIIIPNGTGKESSSGGCSLIDLSPGGAKLYAEYNIPLESKPVRIHVEFTLQEEPIEVKGEIVWKKPYRSGQLYGFKFDEDLVKEEIIIKELKLRRHSESKNTKKNG